MSSYNPRPERPSPSRRTALRFLAGATAALTYSAAASAASLSPAPAGFAPDGRCKSALVLSGGGARGAYEAGVIEGLANAAGVADGEALPGFDVIVGTSIGAINGWFVATAQYSALRSAWQDVSASNLFRPKRRYAALENPRSGFLTRIVESLSLLSSLNRTMDGIFDPGPINDWIRARVDPDQHPVVPFYFNAADICNMRAAYFYVSGPDIVPAMTKALTCSIEDVSGMAAVTQAAGQMLHDALYASIALPLLLDPIKLRVGDVDGLFVDGGSCDNSAIDVARILACRVNVILVDPATVEFNPKNAVEAGLGSFNLLQRRALDASLRSAYFETAGKRLFQQSATRGDQRAYLDSVFDADLAIMRPASDMGTGYGDFHDTAKIRAFYELGVRDAARGWSTYGLPSSQA
jgi:predicted acylesterase/phospholipase RssA